MQINEETEILENPKALTLYETRNKKQKIVSGFFLACTYRCVVPVLETSAKENKFK